MFVSPACYSCIHDLHVNEEVNAVFDFAISFQQLQVRLYSQSESQVQDSAAGQKKPKSFAMMFMVARSARNL